MTEQELREKIAVFLVARDDEMSLEEGAKMLDSWKVVAQEGHYGDCTNEPNTCSRCLVDRTYEEANNIFALIEEANYVKLADDQSLPRNPNVNGSSQLFMEYDKARDDMLNAVFRKVILKEQK